jgi:hypothetical protein
MGEQRENYKFINMETGNVIAYFSARPARSKRNLLKKLEKKRIELALKMGLYFEHIYWRHQ